MMFNSLFKFTQTKLNFLYENSLFLQNLDKLIFLSIILVFLTSTYCSSDVIGFISLITIFLTLLQFLVKPGEKCEPVKFELWLLAYFMIVVISLAGSSLFDLSLKGFMKTAAYIGFYVSVVHYLKHNIRKIPYIIAAIGVCISFESIAGILQNFRHVDAIATWQDVSKLNPEQIMTRVYGTLKPFNPNLLGGYFVAGIPSVFAFSAYLFFKKQIKAGVISGMFAVLSVITLFLTGCRGAYIGCMMIFAGIFSAAAKFLWNKYKKIFSAIFASCLLFGLSAVMFVSSLKARVFSIFAMRHDSSNSFRFNVYHSSIKMFIDNWLLGIGVGNKNFREIYGLYMRTGFDALSAYNIFLEIAVESGLFALIAFVGFLVIMLKDSIKFIMKHDRTCDVIFAAAAVISIFAVIVHGLVDTVFFRPQIQFVFWTMAAIISAILQNQNTDESF